MNKDTFHRFNRLALLGILLFSMIIPLCNFSISVEDQTDVHETIIYWEKVIVPDVNADSVEVNNSSSIWIQSIILLYIVGIFFFILRHVYSLIRMLMLLKTSEYKVLEGGVKLIVHKMSIAPFSWMRYVVISEKDMDENGREILLHEFAHIKNRHSIDLLLVDICVFFQWFNPAAWLLKQEMQNVHEYEADETVIKEGVDAKQYQLLLIKKAVGKRLYSMANSFNHSKLKKRITMMSKQKSSPWARLKYLYVLPVAIIAVSAFARPEISSQLDEISNIKVNDFAEIVTVNPEDNSNISESSITENVQVFVVSNDSIENKTLKTKVVNLTLDIDSLSSDKKLLVIVDGNEVSMNIMQALKSSHIKSIDILKDVKALKSYGKKGENGVIKITLKSKAEINDAESDKELTNIRNTKLLKAQVTLLDKDSSPSADSGVIYLYKEGGEKPKIYVHGLKTDSLKGDVKKVIVKRGNSSKLSDDSDQRVYLSVSGGSFISKDSVLILKGKTTKIEMKGQ